MIAKISKISNHKPAEKSFCRSEDGSAGGGWGEECRAVRAKSAKPRGLLVQSRTPKKSFVFIFFRCFFSIFFDLWNGAGGGGEPHPPPQRSRRGGCFWCPRQESNP